MSALLRQLEQQNRLPPGLLGAVMMAESSGNPQAVSPKGAAGLFQFMPATAQQYGIDPYSPLQAAQGAAAMLGDLSQKYKGSLPHVLSAYNWGSGNVDRKGLQNAPSETRNYISKILSSLNPIGTANASEQPDVSQNEQPVLSFDEWKASQSNQPAASQAPQVAGSQPMQEEQVMSFDEWKSSQAPQVASSQQAPATEEPAVKTVKEDSSFGADAIDFIKNAGLGFAARGNQAMAAINPWGDKERIKREQQWVKEHSGAGVGEALADMMMLSPLAAVGGVGLTPALARATGTGVIEAATKPGNLSQRAEDVAIGTIGGLLGEGLGAGLKLLNRPFKSTLSSAQQALATKADKLGIPLSAAQRTGNQSLKYAQDALESLPISSKMEATKRAAQRKAWTSALMQQAGENADNASPEVMGAMKDRISGMYDDIATRSNITFDKGLKSDLSAIRDKYLSRLPTNQKGIVKSYLKDLNKPAGASIDGRFYQDTRSMLSKQAQGFKNSDPVTAEALKGIRNALDNAFARNVSKADKLALDTANRQWSIMKQLESAIDPLTHEISPDKLLSNITRRDSGSVLYGKGEQSLAELARIGKQFIGSKVPSSGTAERSLWQSLIRNPLGAGGGYVVGGIPGAVAGLALPPIASTLMWNPNRYLTKGLLDLGEQSMIPGITREGLLNLLMLELGSEATK